MIRGHSLDGSNVGRTGSNAQPGGTAAAAQPHDDTPEGRFHVSAKLERMAMRDGISITPFNLDLAGNGNRPAALTLSGGVAQGAKTATIAANLETSATGRKVTLTMAACGLAGAGACTFRACAVAN